MGKRKADELVKITAMLPRELWARLRAESVRRGVPARELLTTAVDRLLKEER